MTVEEWLIDAVRVRPIIWNTKDENYKNTKMKNESYNEIAKESNLTVDEIKKKWHSIRSAFSRELRMRNLYSTIQDIPNQKREWKHFNKLMFLKDECKLELDGQVENDFTISIISEDDGSSTSYHLPNNNSTINSNNNTTNSSQQNGQSTTTTTTTTNQKSNSTAKKRKINSNSNNNSTSSSSVSLNNQYNNQRQPNQSKNTLMQSSFNFSKFNALSEEEVFGQSIAASLKKFDDKKKEIVKLKLQEVIVQYLND